MAIGQILTRTDREPSAAEAPVDLPETAVNALAYVGSLALTAYADRLKQHVEAEAEQLADKTWDLLRAMLRRQLRRGRSAPIAVETATPDTGHVAIAIDESAEAVLAAAAILPTMSPQALARARRTVEQRLTRSGVARKAAHRATQASHELVARGTS